jgi:hypothetical protein
MRAITLIFSTLLAPKAGPDAALGGADISGCEELGIQISKH